LILVVARSYLECPSLSQLVFLYQLPVARRIVKHIPCSTSVFATALVFVDRVISGNEGFSIFYEEADKRCTTLFGLNRP
jgi:hypothetical protein